MNELDATPDDDHPEIDEARRTLFAQLDLAAGFWVAFVFTASEASARALRRRVEEKLRSKAQALALLTVASPDELRTASGLVLEPAHAGRLVWLEALRVDPPLSPSPPARGPWADAWWSLGLRLNERRDRLQHDLRNGFVVVAPLDAKVTLREAAPDLWSVRSFVVDVPLVPREGTDLGGRAAAAMQMSGELSVPVTAAEHALADARAAANANDVPGALGMIDAALAAAPRHGRSRIQLAALGQELALGWANDRAGAYAQEMIEVANARFMDGATPEAHRDLSQSWVSEGDVRHDEGDLEGAANAYEGALGAAQRRIERFGESPDALAGVGVVLSRAGAVRLEHGDRTAARSTFEETLAIARRLVAIGESLEALTNLSVSLNKLGDLRESEGDWAGAQTCYEESLAIMRRITNQFGETPRSLRDLVASLQRVGDLHMRRNDHSNALPLYEESLAIQRRIVESDETTRTIDDLQTAVERIGGAREAARDLAGSRAARAEALLLARRLVTVADKPRWLRALAASLIRLGSMQLNDGDFAGASSSLTEGLSIAKRIVERFGETPTALRDVVVSLGWLGRIRFDSDGAGSAIALFEEAHSIARHVVEKWGETRSSLEDLRLSLTNLANIRRAAADESGAAAAESELADVKRKLGDGAAAAESELADVKRKLGDGGE